MRLECNWCPPRTRWTPNQIRQNLGRRSSCDAYEPATYDWFTTCILANGSQTIHLRPRERRQDLEVLFLNRQQSRLLMNALNEIAHDETLPYGPATQAVYRAFWSALKGQ